MAESNSHKFGQVIGALLEIAIEPHLKEFADKHGLFLDKKGHRLARTGKKLTWSDIKENKHDLDYVLERGGSPASLGSPVAFIEIAWRRYTKHSRNKAQEIQGAIIPLLEKYSHVSPFAGVVLAGEFTKGSLDQLKSQGFAVMYISYRSVLQAFKSFGIDAASDEGTSEEEFKAKLVALEKLETLNGIAEELIKNNGDQVKEFFSKLEHAVSRYVQNIIIWPLHGERENSNNIEDAINFIKKYSEEPTPFSFVRYEIIIQYNTGTVINARCINKMEAIEFLERNVP